MYSRMTAVLLNSIFGICLVYAGISIWFMMWSNFVTDLRFIAGFSLFNIVWLMLDIFYNRKRYQKKGGSLFFWLSLLLPPVLIIVILAWIIIYF